MELRSREGELDYYQVVSELLSEGFTEVEVSLILTDIQARGGFRPSLRNRIETEGNDP